MEKTATLVLRISSANKATIKAAAESINESFTTFITEAALKRAQQVAKRPPARGVHAGVPSFFRACCVEAAYGGENGYHSAGWHLANAIGSQSPDDLDVHEWQEEVEKLKALLADDDGEGVWNWYKRHYPKCMALVPARRREQFVGGVQSAYEDGRVEV